MFTLTRPDIRYVETPSEPGGDPAPVEQAPTEEVKPTEEQKPAADPATEEKPSPEDGLPQWAQVEIKNLRKEAAERRVANRELTDKLSSMKSAEEVEQATSTYVQRIAELELRIARETAARDAQLPAELAERLTGTTPEELAADAKKLAALIPAKVDTGEVEPSGGLDPSDKTPAFDPVKAAHAARARRY